MRHASFKIFVLIREDSTANNIPAIFLDVDKFCSALCYGKAEYAIGIPDGSCGVSFACDEFRIVAHVVFSVWVGVAAHG